MSVPLGKRLRRELRVRALLFFLPLLSLLPHRLAVALGAFAGHLGWYLTPRHRKAALEHLALAFPEKNDRWRRSTGRASFRNLGRAALETIAAGRSDLRAAVEFAPGSREALHAAHAEGKGVMAFSCHLGSWELLARRVAAEGLPVAAIAREAQDPRLTALLERSRASSGIASLWRGDKGAIRDLIRRLRAGSIIAALIDQDTAVAGHFVPFFGRAAHTPRAPADLALRTGAAAIFAGIHRVAPTRLEATILRLPLPDSGDGEADSRALTAHATAAIESAIRAHPEQWVWMHARWRTRP
jgi:KDO2-lipid IV(A) lauroyltransferase